MPAVLGHESAGVVEQVGSEVRYVAPGDHVITCLSVFCGHCEYCLKGAPVALRQGRHAPRRRTTRRGSRRRARSMHQFLDLSSFAEQMLVHENAVVKIRKDMPLDRAALIGCGVTTGVGAVFNTAKVPAGATVAVIGCGGVGLSAIQGARIAGAGRIIAVDTLAAKLELAKRFGATDVVNASDGDPVEQVKQLTGGGVDYSFEAIGLKKTAEQAFGMLQERRHRDGDRHDPARPEDRAAGRGLPVREEDPGLEHGLERASAWTCRATSTSTCRGGSTSTTWSRSASGWSRSTRPSPTSSAARSRAA